MLAVIFEVEPKPGKTDAYLGMAADLAPLLKDVEGFISIERFQSLTNEGKLLSLSFWRDEASLEAWRNVEKHRQAQAAGREQLFANYRLRIASVVRDYGMQDREQVPADSKALHDRGRG